MRIEDAAGDWSDVEIAQRAQLLAALGHPVRVRIVTRLLSEEQCVGGIVGRLGLPQPLVSRHLAVLRDAGVVAVERRGRQRSYRVVHPCARALLHCLHQSWLSAPSSTGDQHVQPRIS